MQFLHNYIITTKRKDAQLEVICGLIEFLTFLGLLVFKLR